jgi:hypothetical protein
MWLMLRRRPGSASQDWECRAVYLRTKSAWVTVGEFTRSLFVSAEELALAASAGSVVVNGVLYLGTSTFGNVHCLNCRLFSYT